MAFGSLFYTHHFGVLVHVKAILYKLRQCLQCLSAWMFQGFSLCVIVVKHVKTTAMYTSGGSVSLGFSNYLMTLMTTVTPSLHNLSYRVGHKHENRYHNLNINKTIQFTLSNIPRKLSLHPNMTEKFCTGILSFQPSKQSYH